MPEKNIQGPAPGIHLPIQGGERDGSTFFMGDTQVLVDQMDAITSVPTDLGDGVQRVFVYWTFVGNEVGTNQPKGVTLIMPIEMLKAIPGNARKLFLGIPVEYRNPMPGRKEDTDPDAFLRALKENSGE